MMDYSSLSDSQLQERSSALANAEGWAAFVELTRRQIARSQDVLERSPDRDVLIRQQERIKILRSVLTFYR